MDFGACPMASVLLRRRGNSFSHGFCDGLAGLQGLHVRRDGPTVFDRDLRFVARHGSSAQGDGGVDLANGLIKVDLLVQVLGLHPNRAVRQRGASVYQRLGTAVNRTIAQTTPTVARSAVNIEAFLSSADKVFGDF